ncbi:hypothetical protein EVAR_69024_1 [Eumeta japonica]|uniref:Uncharacterized protein n=1 Tax=Eumeta variegata TaxID=151549 RepID=A0A4C2A6A8_EUMVA|nr:hypothetical protein EVAR_69024_1 [Eumeta japonica]
MFNRDPFEVRYKTVHYDLTFFFSIQHVNDHTCSLIKSTAERRRHGERRPSLIEIKKFNSRARCRRCGRRWPISLFLLPRITNNQFFGRGPARAAYRRLGNRGFKPLSCLVWTFLFKIKENGVILIHF